MKNNSVKINQNTIPIIKVIDKDKFYDIYIILKNFTKEEIILKYINNFLVLDLSLKDENNDLFKLKKILYLNKVNIDNIQSLSQSNYIYLKLLKI